MKAIKSLVLSLAVGLATFAAAAQTGTDQAHHPQGASPTPAQAMPMQSGSAMPAVNDQLQRMHDMSRRLGEAKTPQERQALLAEHQKVMQDGMAMMGQMSLQPRTGMPMGGGNAMGMMEMMGGMMQHQGMMEMRMEMMQAMMQMMMDRMD
jgi:hypothetical protein